MCGQKGGEGGGSPGLSSLPSWALGLTVFGA